MYFIFKLISVNMTFIAIFSVSRVNILVISPHLFDPCRLSYFTFLYIFKNIMLQKSIKTILQTACQLKDA